MGPLLSPAMAGRVVRSARIRRWLDPLSALSPRRRTGGSPRRIGVLLQWGIGDAVTTLPLLGALHDRWPDAALELIGKPFLDDLLGAEPGVAACHPLVPPWVRFSGKYRLWDSEWRRYGGELVRLRGRGFDLLVAPRFDARDVLQARLLRAAQLAGFGAAGGRHWLDWNAAVSPEEGLGAGRAHLAARLAEAIAGRPADPVPRFRRQLDGSEALKRFRAAGYQGGPILAVAFGASHPIRRWDAGKIDAVLHALKGQVGFFVIIAEPGEPSVPVAAPAGARGMIWQSGLRELADMFSAVNGLFCTDSGAMHVAAAAGCPVAAVFGPGDPAMFAPPGPGHRILAAERMPCRPCYDACLYDRPICFDDITVEQAIDAVRGILSLA